MIQADETFDGTWPYRTEILLGRRVSASIMSTRAAAVRW